MNLFTKNTFRNFALSMLSAAALSACGGAGSCTNCSTPTPTPTPSPGTLSLSIAAPSQYPAGVAVTAYLTMTNTSSVNGNNLVYTIPSDTNYTGVTITANPTGAGEDCANIAAGASCTFTASIPAGSKPGSFTVLATPNSTASAKTTQSGKSFQADSISVTANLGLVDVPNTQNQYYILPSDQTITANANGATTVMISVWVKQASEGLSSLRLVDEAGAALTYVTVGTPSYAINSVNTYRVTIPAGKTLQHIQAFGYNNDTSVCNTLNIGTNNNTACSNDADVNLATQGNGILTIQPSYTVMSESYNTQVITLTNTGTGDVSSITYPNWGELASQFSITNNNCTSLTKLSAGQSCTMILNYTANSLSSAITPVFSYDDDNNGVTSPKNTDMTIQYVGTSSTAFSLLNLNPSSIGLTQQNPRRVITLTNVAGTGTNGATITNLVLPTLSAPLQFESTNCTSTLAVGNSCIYTIKYSSAVSANQASLPFTYNNGVSAGQTASLAVDWSVSTPPQLSSETPVNNSVDVSLATSVSITFDESMDLTTLVASNFQLQKITDSSFITLSSPIYSIDGKTVTFATSSGTANPALVASSEYKIIIPVPANIKNAIGTSLNLPLVEYPNGVISTFTTANVTQCGNTAWAGILNSATNSFTKCLWQSDGSLYDCSGGDTPIGLFSTPSVILPDGYGSLYSANSGANSLAYYIGANYGSVFNSPSPLVSLTTPAISGAQVKYNLSKGFVFVNTTGGLNICGINTGTGALTTCAAASPAGLSPDAYGSGFSSNGSGSGIFWTANKNANTVSFCPATSDNPTVIAQCNDAGGSKFNQPSAIYATNTYVLVANAGDNTIVRCDQSSGVLSNCAYTGGNINGPSSIVAGASYSSNFIYVTNKVDNSVTVCKNSGGVLSSCNRMIYPSGTFNSPTSIYVYDACSAG